MVYTARCETLGDSVCSILRLSLHKWILDAIITIQLLVLNIGINIMAQHVTLWG